MRWTPLVLAMALAGCAGSEACKTTVIERDVPTVIVKTIVIRDRTPTEAQASPKTRALVRLYQGTLDKQLQVVKTAPPNSIIQLTTLNNAAAQASVPLNTAGHKPTDDEVKNFVDAYSKLNTFLGSNIPVFKPSPTPKLKVR